MPAFETLIAYSIAASVLCISPGPSNLYIMARTMGQGHQAGIAAASGMAIGSFIYVFATALGIAAIFKYSPVAYVAVKVAGACYLIYLGYHYIANATSHSIDKPHLKHLATPVIFKQSVIVELTNPKTALFFLAFLPQFVDTAQGNVALQLFVLGCIYAVIAFCSDLLVVFLSSQLGKWLMQHPLFAQWQERISGSILLILGGFILFEQWQESSDSPTN